MPFVARDSVVSGWYLGNQATPCLTAIARKLLDDRAWAPAFWELELANVPRTACQRRRIAARQAQQVLEQIARLPIELDRHPVPRGELLALALRFGPSSYDAATLERALRLQLPLAMQDEALRTAAQASGAGHVA